MSDIAVGCLFLFYSSNMGQAMRGKRKSFIAWITCSFADDKLFAHSCSTSGALCARLFTKGAAEILLDQCSTRVAEDSSVTYLNDAEKQQILQSFAKEGSLRWASISSTAHVFVWLFYLQFLLAAWGLR